MFGRGAHRLLIALIILITCLHALANEDGDVYCGEQGCYETLGLKYGATTQQIRRTYHKLALKYHPDKNKDPSVVPKFRAIVNAYEVLSNPQTKANYDDMMERPEQFYVHRMRYYRHRMTQIRVSTVLIGFILLLTLFQYFYWKRTHYRTVLSLREHPEVIDRLNKLRQSEGRAHESDEVVSTDFKVILAAQKEQETRDYHDILKVANINGWQGRSPGVMDLLPVHLFWLPFNIFERLCWCFKWAFWHGWMSQEYTSAVDTNYATSLALKVPWHIWSSWPYKSRKPLLDMKLWHNENLEKFKKDNGVGQSTAGEGKPPKKAAKVMTTKAAAKAAVQAAALKKKASAA